MRRQPTIVVDEPTAIAITPADDIGYGAAHSRHRSDVSEIITQHGYDCCQAQEIHFTRAPCDTPTAPTSSRRTGAPRKLDQPRRRRPSSDDRVAITDNAEPRLNVLEYSRGRHVAGDRLVCKPPLFAPRAGKNSFMGYGRFLVVENNAGHDVFPATALRNTEPGGAARVDLGTRADGRRVVRESREISQTTAPKLSLANGLVHLYTALAAMPPRIDAHYLNAFDVRTGAALHRAWTDMRLSYDYPCAPASIGPDGTACLESIPGLLAVRDR